MEGLAGLLPFVLIALVFWLLLIRPQRRRQLDLLATQKGVQVGDEVMLGAGIVGRVADGTDEFLDLEIAPGVRMKVARAAVVRVLLPEEPADADAPTGPGGATAVTDETTTDPTDPSRDH